MFFLSGIVVFEIDEMCVVDEETRGRALLKWLG